MQEHTHTHEVWFICVHTNTRDTNTTDHKTRAQDNHQTHISHHGRTLRVHQGTKPTTKQPTKKKTKTKLCFLRLALLLTEDNNLRTASPGCLALGVSACLCLSICTHCATVACPAASCHWRVPTHSLTVWPKCLGNKNRPESWVSPR